MAAWTPRWGAALASWETISGCGAGSSTGTGGLKWMGRSARGGLFQLQSQGNYTKYKDGYVFTSTSQIIFDVAEKWSVGATIPYHYKYQDDPFNLMQYDLSNAGFGDVNLMGTRKFGAINATTLTLLFGLPTGVHDAKYKTYVFKQDRQLGAGEFSGALVLDHTLDNIWGPVVVGGALSYPGRENSIENYRSPSLSVYAYAGYLLGPLVPAIGASVTGFAGHDRDRGLPNERPPVMFSPSATLEWSNDYIALLAGISLPFSYTGVQPWTVGLGLTISPF